MEEEYRDLKVLVKRTGVLEDYTGLYTVSTNGTIRDTQGNIVQQRTSKQYSPYKVVYLKNSEGKVRERLVHRIVASTYTDICGDFNEVVNHLDEDKLNNAAYNLSWTTNRENLVWGTAQERAVESRRINKAKRLLPKPKIDYSARLFNF